MNITEKVARHLYSFDGGSNFDNSSYSDMWLMRAAEVVAVVMASFPTSIKEGTLLNLHPDQDVPDYAVRLTYDWARTGTVERYTDQEIFQKWPKAIVVKAVPLGE